MTSRSERRRSGVWQPDAVERGARRHREPDEYHQWYAEQEKQQQDRPTQSQPRRRPSMPLRQSDTSSTMSGSATIRPVTPDNHHAGFGAEYSNANLPENTTMNFERVFIPHTTTTIVGGAAARDSPNSSSKRRLRGKDKDKDKEYSRDREARSGYMSQASSPPGSRNGSISIGNSSFLRQVSSGGGGRSNGQRPQTQGGVSETDASSRPRTRTLDERSRREQSPTALPSKSRNRIGSVHTPSSPPYQDGATFLASVPAAAEMHPSPITSLGSPTQTPASDHRSISPVSSSTVDSITSALPSANARRILHLMKTLNGRMSGNIIFRRGFGNPWAQSYCYIQEESGSLMFESRASEGAHKTLISDLRGATVRSNLDGDIPYLEVTFPYSTDEVHIKLQTQSDFDAWFAALLHWQPRDIHSSASTEQRPSSDAGSKSSAFADASKRRASVNNPVNRNGRDRAASDRSNRSDRRQSVIATPPKENPVIKIGKMIYWDTNVGYTNSSVGQPSSRPSNSRMQSVGARRWRRISGQLRENGELKLHSDADNSLLSVVQLSQLSRCAIQRLDPSVLENDFCIAIYPQYTSTYTNTTQPGFIRPIFLSLESRVLYEVWFVLLRAFTMPSIYGPRLDAEANEHADFTSTRDLESMIATSTTYTFRMERSLAVRIVEAKMRPSTSSNSTDNALSGGSSRPLNALVEKHGYYAEVQLDNETRAKTVVKYEGMNPLWGESFQFQDLPPVLNSASVIVKKRPSEQASFQQQDNKQINDTFGEQQGGFTNLASDVTCGKVEIQMEELEPEKEIEKWWPVMNMHGHRLGDILVKVRADEGIVLMARDYRPLGDLLYRFANGLTLQIAQLIPSELKRLSDSFLDIFQVSGKAGDWLMALVEDEIDGIHKETPITRLRYTRRVGSNDNDPHGSGAGNTDRELIVRDMNKNATLEANLLFRGNTLLTKSLDTHMRRVGKEYLEESLATKLQEINDKDLDCEVDPNRVSSPHDVDRNWRRLLLSTQEVWKGIIANKSRCPIELRIVFRHIRACAEDRYGDFLRSVSFSSVSGFLFLRFFCPAVLNPKLFGLIKDDIKPRARRTFTLIAKSLQTMANMASFGTKEPWMEPMNAFLVQHRESFKSFIDDICYVPAPLSSATFGPNPASPTYPPGVVSAEQHLSYTTPMTIMQRLPPSSREGFPSLPYLIDQARSFAELIHLWLEAINALSNSGDSAALPGRTHADVLAAIEDSDGDLKEFHHLCEELNARTQECLNRAERAERPDSPHSFQWEDVINQLQKSDLKGPISGQDPFDVVAEKIASDPTILPEELNPAIEATLAQLRVQMEANDEQQQRIYAQTPPQSEPANGTSGSRWRRPGSASLSSSFQGSMARAYPHGTASPGQSASASVSNVSSAVSSDTEHTVGTTALPSYDREIRHRERREAARLQIQRQMEAARVKESDKEKKKMNKLVPKLGKKHKQEKEKESSTKSNGMPSNGNGMI